MSFILSISAKTKRPECEIGDVVAVYDFEPTATEREIFDVTEVAKVKAAEIMAGFEQERDEKKKWPKYKANIGTLTTADKSALKKKSNKIADLRSVIQKIEIKNPLA